MTYNFPENWRKEINSVSELSKLLDVPKPLLLKISSEPKRYYYQKTIKKKDGGKRMLTVPNKELKPIQRAIHDKLFNFDFPPMIHGGIKNRSIKTNAFPHRQKKWVAGLDIKDFYPSVNFERIKVILKALGYSPEVTQVLTAFTTYEFQLPQGTPTSPILANLALYNLDKRIEAYCKNKRLAYTRYFDDISISGNTRLTSTCDKVEEFIKAEGFHPHPNKREEVGTNKPQIVTGLMVNGVRLKVAPTTVAEMEVELSILADGKLPDRELDHLIHRIQGLISFLKSVNPSQSRVLEKSFGNIMNNLDIPRIQS